ncbi:MAG: hypothetical protein JWO26_1906 [Rhodospirillales bacterium]|nr:hypothetical protein [Rhodospirillales bacterium]
MTITGAFHGLFGAALLLSVGGTAEAQRRSDSVADMRQRDRQTLQGQRDSVADMRQRDRQNLQREREVPELGRAREQLYQERAARESAEGARRAAQEAQMGQQQTQILRDTQNSTDRIIRDRSR